MGCVPAATSTVASTLSVCNRGVSTTFRIAVRPAGASIANQHYLIYDNYVNAGDTIHNPFFSSALDENSTEKKEKEYDFSFIVDDELQMKEISIEDLSQDDLDAIDTLD